MTTPRQTPEEQRQAAEDRRAVLAPNPAEVNEFHRYSDYDNSPESQHHTLGLDDNQASSGGHNHDGRNSKLLSTASLSNAANFIDKTVATLQTMIGVLKIKGESRGLIVDFDDANSRYGFMKYVGSHAGPTKLSGAQLRFQTVTAGTLDAPTTIREDAHVRDDGTFIHAFRPQHVDDQLAVIGQASTAQNINPNIRHISPANAAPYDAVNRFLASGFYNVNGNPTGTPPAFADGRWYFLQVYAHIFGTHWQRQVAYDMTGGSDIVYTRRLTGGDANVAGSWTAWVALGGGVKSVQRGFFTPANTTAPQNTSITAVDPAKSVITLSHNCQLGGSQSIPCEVRAYIINSTNIEFTFIPAPNNGGAVSFQIVEYA